MKNEKPWITVNIKTGRAYLESDYVLNSFTGLMGHSTMPLGDDPEFYKELIIKDKIEVKFVSV